MAPITQVIRAIYNLRQHHPATPAFVAFGMMECGGNPGNQQQGPFAVGASPSEKAVSSPLLETEIDGAHKVLLSIVGGSMLSLWEINEAAKVVGAAAHPDANIIFGASIDPALGEEVWVTVVATGFDEPSTNVQGRLSRLREPSGEPRIERTRSLATARAGAPSYRDAGVSRGSSMRDPEIPEFIPRG